jgi:glycosyltransferase involved in cell wall biosynthesis
MISIVIPSFNQAQFVSKTLTSVLMQDYPVEVIVIDGGSADGSVDVVRSYSGQLAYWVSEPDRGQVHAINKGLERAKGEILCYLNSDDLLHPGALRAVADAYMKNPNADIFHGRCSTIDEEGTPLERAFFGDIDSPTKLLDLWSVWFRGKNVVQPEVFWTRRLMDRIGLFDEAFNYAMDYDYWTRAIVGAGAKVCRIDQDLAAFRLWGGQKSTASEKAADELRKIAIRYIDDPAVALDPDTRRRLKAERTFDEFFAKGCAQIAAEEGSPVSRRMRVAALAMRNPILFSNEAFRGRMTGALRRLVGLGDPEAHAHA